MPTSEKKRYGLATQKDFAKAYNLNEATLSDWKNRNDLWKVVSKDIQNWGKILTPNVLLALYKRAIKLDGGTKDAELWLKYVEGFGTKKPELPEPEPTFTEDDIRTLIKYLPKRKQKKFDRLFTELILLAREVRRKRYQGVAEMDVDISSCL